MLDDLRLLVDDLVRDAVGRLGDDARDRAIGLAVAQYGRDRPRTRVADIAAVAGAPPTLPLPEGWEGGSAAVAIEYPIGLVPPAILPRHLWALIDTPDGLVLGLPPGTAAGAVHRLRWSVAHVVSATEDSVPVADREAVAQYAAAVLLDQVAALLSADEGSTIKADAVDHGKAAANFGARAAAARQRYHDLLGIDPKRVAPAGVVVDPPLAATTGGPRLLWRGGQWRR